MYISNKARKILGFLAGVTLPCVDSSSPTALPGQGIGICGSLSLDGFVAFSGTSGVPFHVMADGRWVVVWSHPSVTPLQTSNLTP